MMSAVIDVDDTLVSTDHRIRGVWRELLGREVPLEDVETLGLEQIFTKYASAEQKKRVGKFQKRFWDIVLCLDVIGVELLKLHEALPLAAEVLQEWYDQYKLVYLTGRTENTRDLTLTELGRFGFPVDEVELLMFGLDDYGRARGLNPSGPTLVDAKARLFAALSKKQHVVKVIDDYPGYFPIYTQFDVPDRIGLLRPKRYTPQQYLDRGATRVITSWRDIHSDRPRAP
jgi:hypothetical protein